MTISLNLNTPLSTLNGTVLTGHWLLNLAADAVESITPDDGATERVSTVRSVAHRTAMSNRRIRVSDDEMAAVLAVLEEASEHWHRTYRADNPPGDDLEMARRLTALADDPDDPCLEYVMFVMTD